jgi:uncharacterized membrane protein
VQWVNFSAWLIAGGLLVAGLALPWAAVSELRAGHRRGKAYLLMLLATFVIGFLNALVHARDGWATMPTGLVLSAVVLVLAAATSVLGLAGWRRRVAP